MSVFFLVFLVVLPHGEFAAPGESGLNSKTRQNPAIEDIPGNKNTEKNQ